MCISLYCGLQNEKNNNIFFKQKVTKTTIHYNWALYTFLTIFNFYFNTILTGLNYLNTS